MKYLIALSLLVVTQSAHADWFCTTQVAERRGYAVLACGNGNTIPNSFAAAEDEFNRICDASVDCAGHNVIVIPKRMERLRDGTYLRLVEFQIQDSMSDKPIKTASQRELDRLYKEEMQDLEDAKFN